MTALLSAQLIAAGVCLALGLQHAFVWFRGRRHPARLLILNLVRMHPRHGEELAAILGLTRGSSKGHIARAALEAGADADPEAASSHPRWLVEALREEVESLRTELARHTTVVDDLARRNLALKKVLEVYTGGVCLLHGAFTFRTVQDGKVTDVTGPDGKRVELEYIGSGFLVSDEGHVVTNRHVAEPWWGNTALAPALATEARLPVAAEAAGRVEAVRAVDPHDAGRELRGDVEGPVVSFRRVDVEALENEIDVL